jgi:hypothetical protein
VEYNGKFSDGKQLTQFENSETLAGSAPFNPTQLTTMKKQMVRISILQSSKIMTALYVLMGFVYTLIAVPMIVFGSPQMRVIGIIYLFMPVIMGVFGFIFFVIFAAIYNLLAQWLGGVELEVKDVEQG